MNYGFVIDNRKCIGCHACTVACKAEHDVPLGVNRTWVKYVEKGTFPDTRRYFSVMRCNHCADAPCVTICPVTALFTREDGIVDFDPNRCIGCKACIQGCPYDAIYIDPNTLTAAKCNFCAHRVEVNLEPPCAVVCPEHAIIAGDMDDPSTEIARITAMQRLTVRKPEKGTEPKVFYIEGERASLVAGAAPVGGAYVWSQPREPGVLPLAPAPPSSGAPDRTGGDGARRVYDAGQTHQGSWGWKVSGYLWTKSIASGCLMLAPLADGPLRLWTLVLSLVFLGLTGALLVWDLKRPERFLWVLTRPQWRSWLTRGSYILLAFGVIASLLLLAHVTGWETGWRMLAGPGVLLGAAGAAYTAFLFWQSRGRDLWQSPLLPIHLLVQAGVAGLAAMLLARVLLEGDAGGDRRLVTWLWRVLVIDAALILAELLAVHQTEDATAAARWALTSTRRPLLLHGVFLIGHVAPIALLIAPLQGAQAAAAAFAAALAALLGLALYEGLYVAAGQSVPLS